MLHAVFWKHCIVNFSFKVKGKKQWNVFLKCISAENMSVVFFSLTKYNFLFSVITSIYLINSLFIQKGGNGPQHRWIIDSDNTVCSIRNQENMSALKMKIKGAIPENRGWHSCHLHCPLSSCQCVLGMQIMFSILNCQFPFNALLSNHECISLHWGNTVHECERMRQVPMKPEIML